MTIPYDSLVPYDSPAFTYDGESTSDTTTVALNVFVKAKTPSWFVLDWKVSVK